MITVKREDVPKVREAILKELKDSNDKLKAYKVEEQGIITFIGLDSKGRHEPARKELEMLLNRTKLAKFKDRALMLLFGISEVKETADCKDVETLLANWSDYHPFTKVRVDKPLYKKRIQLEFIAPDHLVIKQKIKHTKKKITTLKGALNRLNKFEALMVTIGLKDTSISFANNTILSLLKDPQ